jgi:DHA1 family multidrug resistance protein-like MFS transporter
MQCVGAYTLRFNRISWVPQYDRSHGTLAPEHHFPPAMVGAFGYTICLFLFAWTAGRTHWIVPVIASSFFGWGSTLLFASTLSYLPQAYGKWSASALASSDFERQMVTAVMPLVSIPFFRNVGVDVACSILGGISVLLLPIPFLIYKVSSEFVLLRRSI